MRSKFGGGSRRTERGFALLMVLWGLIVLGLMAASFLRETRVGTTLAHNIAENAKAEALAEAGVQRAVLGLLDSDGRTAWRADGRLYRFALGDGTMTIQVQDEGGKIDLNHAPADMLTALFQSTGSNPEAARALADAVLDYVDRDNDRRPAGAEDSDYATSGRTGGAKDAPFDRKEELMNVLGMNRRVYEAIAPYVTVHSGESEVNPLTAPEPVLRMLPTLTDRQRDQIMFARAAGTSRPPRVDVVTIISEAATRGGGRFVREAVLRRGSEAGDPFHIIDWRQTWQPAPASPMPEPGG